MQELQMYFCNCFFPIESLPLEVLTCFDLALLQDLTRLQPKGTWLQAKEQIQRTNPNSAVKAGSAAKHHSERPQCYLDIQRQGVQMEMFNIPLGVQAK